MLHALVAFAQALGGRWYWLMSVALMVEPILDSHIEGYRDWADKYVSRRGRTRVAVGLSFAGILVASFLAYWDEFRSDVANHNLVTSLQGRVAALQSQVVTAKTSPAPHSVQRGPVGASMAGAANRDSAPGPHSGPIGPIAGVEWAEFIAHLPSPCVFRISADPSNKNLAATLQWIVDFGKHCTLVQDKAVAEAEDRPVPPNRSPGIVVHFADGSAFGDRVAQYLAASGFQVSTTRRLRPSDESSGVVWIDVGPGNPWRPGL